MKIAMILKGKKKLLWLCLIGLWACCSFSFWVFYYGIDDRLDASWRTSLPSDDDSLLRAIRNMKANNETGPFSISRWEETDEGRPEYSIQCLNLTGQKGRLGVFKTAAYKEALVEGLSIRLHSYSDKKNKGNWRMPAFLRNYWRSKVFPEILKI